MDVVVGNSIFDSPKLIDTIRRPRDVQVADVSKTTCQTSFKCSNDLVSAVDTDSDRKKTTVVMIKLEAMRRELLLQSVYVAPCGSAPIASVDVVLSSADPVSVHRQAVVNNGQAGQECNGIQATETNNGLVGRTLDNG